MNVILRQIFAFKNVLKNFHALFFYFPKILFPIFYVCINVMLVVYFKYCSPLGVTQFRESKIKNKILIFLCNSISNLNLNKFIFLNKTFP